MSASPLKPVLDALRARKVLRACAFCKGPVTDKPYQNPTARACRPLCARELAHQDHPEIAAGWHRRRAS